MANIEDVQIDNPPEHVWNQIAPNTESREAQSLAAGIEPLTEVSEQDLADNANLFTSSTHTSLLVRFESAAKKHQMSTGLSSEDLIQSKNRLLCFIVTGVKKQL